MKLKLYFFTKLNYCITHYYTKLKYCITHYYTNIDHCSFTSKIISIILSLFFLTKLITFFNN